MPWGDCGEGWTDGGAVRRGDRAAGAEHAAGGRVDRRGRVAFQQDALAAAGLGRVEHGDGGQQRLGVGMARGVEQGGDRAAFDHAAKVEHQQPVRDQADDGEVVGDEDQRQVVALFQIVEQPDDLRLDRDVEGGDRFVADDQFRAGDDGAGDADALRLTAGEFMREAVQHLRQQADGLHGLQHPGAARGAVEIGLETAQRFGDDGADGHARVE